MLVRAVPQLSFSRPAQNSPPRIPPFYPGSAPSTTRAKIRKNTNVFWNQVAITLLLVLLLVISDHLSQGEMPGSQL